jgi:hypothetical protein
MVAYLVKNIGGQTHEKEAFASRFDHTNRGAKASGGPVGLSALLFQRLGTGTARTRGVRIEPFPLRPFDLHDFAVMHDDLHVAVFQPLHAAQYAIRPNVIQLNRIAHLAFLRFESIFINYSYKYSWFIYVGILSSAGCGCQSSPEMLLE